MSKGSLKKVKPSLSSFREVIKRFLLSFREFHHFFNITRGLQDLYCPRIQEMSHLKKTKNQVKIEFNANEITEKRKLLVEVEEEECLGFLEVASVVQLVFVFKKKVSQAFFHVASVVFEEAPVVLLSDF